MNITRTSPISGKDTTMFLPVTEEQITSWLNGTLVQDAFPHLTDGQREFIKTGITPEDWEEVCGEALES